MKKHNLTDTWKYRVPIVPRNINTAELCRWLDTEVGLLGEHWACSYGLDEINYYFQNEKHALICSLRWAR